MQQDKDFKLNIVSETIADVYLSCSWRPDNGQDAAWHIVKELDSKKIKVIGDVTDQSEQDDSRIERIMSSADGFIGVLPFRKSENLTTSPYIYREILVALKLKLPIILFYDSRINLSKEFTNNIIKVKFTNSTPKNDLEIDDAYGVHEIIEGEKTIGNQIGIKLSTFIDAIVNNTKTKPFAFLITRLKEDFAQIRNSISTALYNTYGMPCLWSDDGKHSTNINGVRERARLLIKKSHFIIADLSFDSENFLSENPSRAHEIGMSVAYKKEILLCSQIPRRDPYYSASDMQIEFWTDEKELEKIVMKWLETNKAKIGRRIYNFELKERDQNYNPFIKSKEFLFDEQNKYISPNLFSLSTSERWVTAISLGLIVFSLAKLISDNMKYDATLDLAAIIGGIFTFLFSSDVSTLIQKTLGRYHWLIYILLVMSIMLFGLSLKE